MSGLGLGGLDLRWTESSFKKASLKHSLRSYKASLWGRGAAGSGLRGTLVETFLRIPY